MFLSDVAGSPERATAMHALETGFSELFAQMRRLYLEMAHRVSPGLLPGSYKVFSIIALRDGATLSALAEALHVDKGQMSRTIRDLDEHGLVERTPDPNDGRSALITLSALGRDRLEIARNPSYNRLAHVLDSWTVADISSLADLLHTLASESAARVDEPVAEPRAS
ncbi:MarR family winged helix-turn-helix transcriptional regulator [Microbacterium gorillae]|uniref:MarR family winged helix-turn-helix transcriptional regulator n=1 Tax=Microbacterium gorillae TaxID=1231063 RepID=UPI0006950372|nr:MarR family transcriptional regulator [Microbacterium gorillae]